ncbi:MAG: pirin family protein [Thermoanaerobaculaceae bacterium]|nr:pirin family protein [Thermoanaerobaculaceae bacterium]MDI9620741.1 pirin family protein [Acidobacteriota bacterium]NLH12548.1 pirin family protein [Holophagae bacterium]HPW56814.1 pirin family protein [Thermoanaerobaculaceae bacterium]
MSEARAVTRILTRRPTVEGAGVRLQRVFGQVDAALDPFLLLDDFGSEDPADYLAGFPWHPHRGMETVTYVLAGSVEHGDSLGNRGTISGGDVQWMTAGSGIVHQEMPQRYEGRARAFQLWVNLPAAAKIMDPRYQEVVAATIPEVTPTTGVKVRVIAGVVGGAVGPVTEVMAQPTFLDVTLAPGVAFEHAVPNGHTALAYVIDGDGRFGASSGRALTDGQLAVLSDGDAVAAAAGPLGMRFLLFAGKPLREPVAWYGPVVMTTEEELETAFREYRAGTFVKKRG